MKICKIINDTFSWRLEVDGQRINFSGHDSAEYFSRLYQSMGYEIVWDKDLWERKQQ